MSQLLQDEDCILYVDDGIVASPDLSHHLITLANIFEKLICNNIKLRPSKCEFFKKQVKFLGHIISSQGISQDPEKLAAIKQIPPPKTRKQLQKFLGFLQYYRKFSSKLSFYTSRLRHVLSSTKPWKWTAHEQEIFEEIKDNFLSTVILKHPNFSTPFLINCDSSYYALGAELFQYNDEGDKEVIAFYSRSLNSHELQYTTTEKEMLTIVQVCIKYRTLLLGHEIKVNTDHKALIFFKTAKLTNNRLSRWYLALQEFHLTLFHVDGMKNNTADYLSREINFSYDSSTIFQCYPIFNDPNIKPILFKNSITIDKLRFEQHNDPHIWEITRKLELRDNQEYLKQYCMHNELLFYSPSKNIINWKIIIPENLVRDVILEAHEKYGHFGTNKIYSVLCKNAYFKNMRKRINHYVAACEICQKTKFDRHTLSGFMQPILTRKPGELISTDIYGPVPRTQQGHKFIFVVIDLFSKFTKFYPITKITGDKLANCIIQQWIPTVGKPERILSDNATYFRGQHWKGPLHRIGIQTISTTSYNPSGNPTERVMQELRRFMSVYAKSAHNKWNQYLNFLEFCINSTVHTSTGFSPNEVLFQRPEPNFLNDIINFPIQNTPIHIDYHRITNQKLIKAALQREKYYNKKIMPVKFEIGQLVLLKSHKLSNAPERITKKFHYLFDGPYVITQLFGNNTAELFDQKKQCLVGVHNFKNMKPYKTITN